jgi:hypothetical protein
MGRAGVAGVGFSAASAAMARPHSPQNIAPAGSSVVQYLQITGRILYRLNNFFTL